MYGLLLIKRDSGDQGEENEMGGAYNKDWGTGEVQTGVWWGN
jgi:hypothetical protein